MNFRVRSATSLVAFLVVGFVTAGCSDSAKLVHVKGKIAKNGRPLKVGNGSLDVVFIPIEKKQSYDTYPATVNKEDGTFEVPGKDGKGIPAGQYRISIQSMQMNPTAEINQINSTFGAENSPIIREVTGEATLEIDLAKPTKL